MSKSSFKYYVKQLVMVGVLSWIYTGCVATLQHQESEKLQAIQPTPDCRQQKVVIANIGDDRKERDNSIGAGVSYWLPIFIYAGDKNKQRLPVAHYLAESLTKDLSAVGIDASLINDSYQTLSQSDAEVQAKAANADFLVLSKVTDGKTNFWGFILIPFFEPVWTKVGMEIMVIPQKRKTAKPAVIRIFHKEVEWYFAKVTIFDAIFDAGLFGRHWHSTAWGKTVVSDALALAVEQVVAELEKNEEDKLSIFDRMRSSEQVRID